MKKSLIILIACNISFVIGGNHSLPVLKNEVTSPRSLSTFASLIRDAILSANPFPWEFVKKTLDSNDDFDLMATVQEVIMIQLPLLIPSILGLLCVILVPIITFTFCCCRCCCRNCGVKLGMRDIKNQKATPYILNIFIVVIFVGILCAMGSCIPPSGDILKTSPRMIYRVLEASLDDVKIFLNTFVQDASQLANTTLNTTVEQIKSDLDNLPDTLSKPVTDGASPFIDVIDSKIGLISNSITNLTAANTTLKVTVDNIIGLLGALQTGLTNINNRWSSLKSQCVTDGESFCNLLPDGTGDDALSFSINTTKLTDITDTVSELVSSANSVDLSQYQNLGNTTFTEIPKTIRNASQTAIDSVKVNLDGVPAEIEPVIDAALEAADVDMNFSTILDPVDSNISLFEEHYSLQHYIFLAIGSVFIVLSLIVTFGLFLGCLCTNRPRRSVLTGRTKVGNCGARMLMIYVCVAVLPAMISLLIGSISMLIGANITILCRPLQDLTIFEELVDNGLLFGGESLGKTLLNDESYNVSISYLFKTCRNNGTVFNGLNIQSGMDLMSHFNVSEFVPDLGQDLVDEVSTTVGGINIVNTSLFNDLNVKLDLHDIDTSIISTIITEINSLRLNETSQNMSTLADSLTSVDYKKAYEAISIDLQNLHDNTTVPLISAVNSIQSSLNGLNSSCISMKTVITELSSSLDNLTNFIGNQTVALIVQALDDFLAGMLKVPENMISGIMDTLNANVGHCKSLADTYDTLLATVCGYFLDPFNILWASFYTGGLVAVILMISSCTLSKYFRTPNDSLETRMQHHLNVGNHAISSNQHKAGTDVVLTKFRNLSSGPRDENNIAVFSSDHYQRINERWRQRRKLVSAQPFRTARRKVNPELPEALSKPRPTLGINVDNASHTSDTQDVANSEHEKTKDKIKIYDLENDYSDAKGCNMNEANDKLDSEESTGKVDGFKNTLENDTNVSDDSTIKTGSRNESNLSNDYEIYERSSSRNCFLYGLDCHRYTDSLKKTINHSDKNSNNVTKTSNDVTDFNVNINHDKSLLFPVSQMNGEKKSFHLQDVKTDIETKLITKQKMTNGRSLSELWFRKYKINDATANNSSHEPGKLSNSCSKQLNNEKKIGTQDQIPSNPSNSIGEVGALGSSLSNVSTQRIHFNYTTAIPECYTGRKIVCALCKNKIINENITKDFTTCNEFDVYNYEPSENYRHCNNDHHSNPPDVIVDINDSKADKNKNNSDDDRFVAKYSNSLKPGMDFETRSYVSASDQLKGESHKYGTKLDLIVQPFKSRQQFSSPREAFLFWKYVDDDFSSNSEPDALHQSDAHDLNQSEMSGVRFVHEQLDHHKTDVLKKVRRLEEPTVYNVETEKNSPSCSSNLFGQKPERLQKLAIEAGRLAYSNNYHSHVSSQTSGTKSFEKEERSEEMTVLQPKSLSDLATIAVISSKRSIFFPNTSNTYRSASTRKDKVPVTYF